MVLAFDNNSNLTRCVSLNSSIACSFSLLSSVVSSISNACLSIVSSAERHTWYCSGKCSVTYSLIVPLACSRRYCISRLIEPSATCNSRAVYAWLMPLALISTTFALLHSISAFEIMANGSLLLSVETLNEGLEKREGEYRR